MPNIFYGVKKIESGHWVVVNKEGAILSNNGYPFNKVVNGKNVDIFGSESYTGFSEQKDAVEVADLYERNYLIFEKPKMTMKEFLLLSVARIDWVLATISIVCIIKVFWK